MLRSSRPRPASWARIFGIVVAPVEVQGLDLLEQPRRRQVVEGGVKQLDVVAVGAVEGPADRDAASIGHDRPLPAEFCPVGGVLAGAFAATGCLVQGPVKRHFGEIETEMRS